jgi:hypothetical protein
MAKNGRHNVQPHQGGGWEVKRNGADRASVVKPTKREAEDAGRQISQNQGTELVIKRQDGTIQRRDSHGNDPYPPEG